MALGRFLWQAPNQPTVKRIVVLSNPEERIRELSARLAKSAPGEEVSVLITELKAAIHEYVETTRAKAKNSFPRKAG